MIIEIKRNLDEIIICIEGTLDTINAPMLEKTINENINANEELVFDLKKLKYISSAGLKVLLKAQEKMNKIGFMRIINVCDEIIKIFEINGYIDSFIIE
jgi:anti-sigma B factor antagonist